MIPLAPILLQTVGLWHSGQMSENIFNLLIYQTNWLNNMVKLYNVVKPLKNVQKISRFTEK